MPLKPKVLIIDDDAEIRNVFRLLLAEDYLVAEAVDGIEGIKHAIRETPSIIVLDIMMPKLDGFETCEALRKESSLQNTPIMMVSALRDPHERIRAFKAGADDYITKPFDSDELKARMESKMTRFRAISASNSLARRDGTILCGNLTLDTQALHVEVNGKPVRLGPIDFRLLRYLIENRGRVCSREEILDAVWDSPDRSVRILDTHVLALRKKLEEFDHTIVAVYGSGYVLKSGSK